MMGPRDRRLAGSGPRALRSISPTAGSRGNHLIQGPASQNYKIIDYGEEGLSYPDNSLVVTDNNFVNTAPSATGIYDPNCIPVQTSGNTFTAVNTPVDPPQCEAPLAD